MDVCLICKQSVNDGAAIVILTKKGSQSINSASDQRGDDVSSSEGQRVHQHCRKSSKNVKYIQLAIKQKQSASKIIPAHTPVNLRSHVKFDYQEHCIFCGLSAKKPGNKRGPAVYSVRTEQCDRNLRDICTQRDDEWAHEVQGRITADLHAYDAVYHQQCSSNFRTFKERPLSFSDTVKKLKLQADQHNIWKVSRLLYSTLLTMMMSRLQLVTLFQKCLNIAGTKMRTVIIT